MELNQHHLKLSRLTYLLLQQKMLRLIMLSQEQLVDLVMTILLQVAPLPLVPAQQVGQLPLLALLMILLMKQMKLSF